VPAAERAVGRHGRQDLQWW